jgi:hypothetical protein
MKITEVYDLIRHLGDDFERFALKVRSKNPERNLGYGLVTTDNKEKFQNLIEVQQVTVNETALSFRNFKTHTSFEILNDTSPNILFLGGFSLKNSMEEIRDQVKIQLGTLLVKDVELKDYSPPNHSARYGKVVRVEFKKTVH